MGDSRAVYPLPKFVKRQKVFPGIKDLPPHIRTDFHNRFIRVVIRDIFNSKQPWSNPDVPTLQRMYDKVFPVYTARLRANDTVCHPVGLSNYKKT